MTSFRQATLALRRAILAASLMTATGSTVAAATASTPPSVATGRVAAPALSPALATAIGRRLGGEGLTQSFRADGGLHIEEAADHSLTWSLVPVGVEGSAGRLVRARPGTFRLAPDATRYQLGPMESWYRSTDAGIEQGFTIASRPRGGGARLTVVLSSSGSLRPMLDDPTALSLVDSAGDRVASYDGLSVSDADGTRLPARFELSGHTLGIVVNDARAVFPVTVDPDVQQLVELAPTDDAGQDDEFGFSVALSANGSVAVVGEPRRDSDRGAVYVFSGTDWGTSTELTAPDASTGDLLGTAVAISADGSTVIATATHNDTDEVGALYIFHGTNYGSVAEIGDPGGPLFGASVATSADGSVIIVGAKGDGGPADDLSGAAYVFSGANWGTTTELAPPDPTGEDEFGASVALSSDGAIALVGAPDHNSNEGAAYVFSGTNWGSVSELDPPDASAGQFGDSVALSSNGTVALVGAPADGSTGKAVVLSGTNFGTSQVLVPTVTSQVDEFGASVALSSSGSTALVGDPFGGSNAYQGAAYLYDGTNWATGTQITASDGYDYDNFANAVALSSDGGTLLAGDANGPGINGDAYLYQTSVTVTVSGTEPYGGTPTFSYTTTPASVNVSSLSCATVNGSTAITSSLPIGSYTILGGSCSGSAGTYSASYAGASGGFVVSPDVPSTPTITNLPAAGQFGSGFVANVTTTGDGTTSITSSTPPVCTVNGSSVSFVGAGTCTLVAHVAAGTHYAAADGTPQGIQVSAVVPGSPTGVSAIAGITSALVSWTDPSNGGATISSYTATAAGGGGQFCSAPGAAATSCIVSGLSAGTSYAFTVTATNSVGTSQASAPSNAITAVAAAASAAPPPVAAGSTTFGTPVSVTTQTGKQVELSEASGGTTTEISIPAGALPSGTTVSAYPVTNNSTLRRDLPAGDNYVASVAITWQTPSGTSPAASAPITITIVDPSIKKGDAIYVLESGHLTKVGTATEDGRATITITKDPLLVISSVPVLTVSSPRATLGTAGIALQLTCQRGGECRGPATLTLTPQGALGKKPLSVEVAAATISLAAGTTATVVFTPTAIGRALFADGSPAPEFDLNLRAQITGSAHVLRSTVSVTAARAAPIASTAGGLTLSSVVPASAASGELVVLRGSGLYGADDTIVASFNGRLARTTCASLEVCSVIVPSGLHNPVVVRLQTNSSHSNGVLFDES